MAKRKSQAKATQSSLEKARARNRRYVEKHREELLERMRLRYAENIELSRQKQREWRKNNPERVKEIHARYRAKHKARINERHRAWSASNADAIVRYRLARKLANADEIRRYAREWARQKRKAEPLFVLINRVRCRARDALRTASARSSKKTLDLLGCTAHALASHMECLFTKGMTWDNMSQWHIDHIVPVSAFDLTDPEQQAAAFHYTNLQPLWAEDNLRKSDKVREQNLFGFAYADRIAVGEKPRRSGHRKHGTRQHVNDKHRSV